MRLTEGQLRRIIREAIESLAMDDGEVTPESIENFLGKPFELSGEITGKIILDPRGDKELVYIANGKDVEYYIQTNNMGVQPDGSPGWGRQHWHQSRFEKEPTLRKNFWNDLDRATKRR